ncbi:phosphotransferase family protein [Natrarchaeobius sp. A-rgal3]|uniref:phosphotransferase family protein n=1 Tax=Natrarchaeobius versutus TaxID=1679078 RepID=UPI00350FC035
MTLEGEPEPTADEVARAVAARVGRPVSSVVDFDEGMNAVYRVSFDDGPDAVLKAGTVTGGSKLLSGPVLLERIDRETNLPVPDVLAVAPDGDEHVADTYFLLTYVDGRHITDVTSLSASAHERLVREAGRHLAAIHDLPFDGPFGRLHASDGELFVDYGFESWAECLGASVDYHLERLEARFADLEPAIEDAISRFPSVVAEDGIDKSVLYRDYHPKNLVLAPDDDARPLVRAVLDVNFRPVGDAPLDLAIAEANLVDLPMGNTDRAQPLRNALRESYVEARGGTHETYVDERYPYYRLVAALDFMCHFEYFGSFGWENEVDHVADRLDTFVRKRIAEIT